MTARRNTAQAGAKRTSRLRAPTQPRLIDQRVRVRLTAPSSLYDGRICEVDAADLQAAAGTDRLVTVEVIGGASTIAFADELELVDSESPVDGADRGDGRPE